MGVPSWVGSQGDARSVWWVDGWMVGLYTAVRGRFCSCDVRETGETGGGRLTFRVYSSITSPRAPGRILRPTIGLSGVRPNSSPRKNGLPLIQVPSTLPLRRTD